MKDVDQRSGEDLNRIKGNGDHARGRYDDDREMRSNPSRPVNSQKSAQFLSEELLKDDGEPKRYCGRYL